MNKILYKGYLTNINEIEEDVELYRIKGPIRGFEPEIIRSLKNDKMDVNKCEDIVLSYINDITFNKKNFPTSRNTIEMGDDLYTMLNVLFNDDNKYALFKNTIYIIFEMIKSNNGELYGKEITSGYIFPILTKDFCIKTFESKFISNAELLRIYATSTYEFKHLALCNCGIIKPKVATLNEVDTYTKRANNKEHISSIKKYYQENVYTEEIIEDRKEELNEEEKLCANITFLLSLIAKFDIKQKNNFEDKFKELLNQRNTCLVYTEFDNTDFEDLIKEMKLFLSHGICEENMLSKIEEAKSKAILDIINDKETIYYTLDELDTIFKTYNQSKYKIPLQNRIVLLNSIALHYILILKNNIDNNNLILNNTNQNIIKELLPFISSNMIDLYSSKIIDQEINKEIDSIQELIQILTEMKYNKLNDEEVKLLLKTTL